MHAIQDLADEETQIVKILFFVTINVEILYSQINEFRATRMILHKKLQKNVKLHTKYTDFTAKLHFEFSIRANFSLTTIARTRCDLIFKFYGLRPNFAEKITKNCKITHKIH